MENLGIDIKLLLAQAINFVLFFIIIKKFVSKPFMSFLQEEKNKEKEKQRLLESAQKQEEAFLLKEKTLTKRMKEEMNKVLQDAKLEASKIKADLIIEAKEEAATIKNNAKKEMEAEKESLYSEVKKKVSDLSLFIVNKALDEVLDEDLKKKVTQKILNSLPNKVDFHEN